MNKSFVKDFINKDDVWKIYKINNDESLKYFNMSNKNNIDEKELNLIKTEINKCNYINLSNKILYSIMHDDCIKFLNVYDNKFYEVYNVFFNYRDCSVILYYCNKDDPFIVVQTSCYMDFEYIVYASQKEFIQISGSNGIGDYYIVDIINTINYVNTNITTILHINNYKKYLFFGFNANVGHHLWNEVSGLYYFLENEDYHNKIEGIIIGPYDFFNMEYILKKKYNFNVIKFIDIFKHCRHCYYKNLENIFPIFLNNYFIDKNVKNLLEYNNIINDDIINDDNILEFSIDIRTFRRNLINQDIFYTKLINRMLDDYKNYIIKINFLGYFQMNNSIIDTNTNVECIEQNKIVNNIIQNFTENKNIIFKNFIGQSFFSIKNNVIKSKIFIHSFGTSSSNLMNWIYNVKIIVFGPIEAYNWTNIFDLLKNDYILCPKEYILTNNGLQNPFDVDFDLYYIFFKNKLNELL